MESDQVRDGGDEPSWIGELCRGVVESFDVCGVGAVVGHGGIPSWLQEGGVCGPGLVAGYAHAASSQGAVPVRRQTLPPFANGIRARMW
nr:hypothetical protein GCM10017745_46450 [Saccharothrix mutabilis subsp. capreolus]